MTSLDFLIPWIFEIFIYLFIFSTIDVKTAIIVIEIMIIMQMFEC